MQQRSPAGIEPRTLRVKVALWIFLVNKLQTKFKFSISHQNTLCVEYISYLVKHLSWFLHLHYLHLCLLTSSLPPPVDQWNSVTQPG